MGVIGNGTRLEPRSIRVGDTDDNCMGWEGRRTDRNEFANLGDGVSVKGEKS